MILGGRRFLVVGHRGAAARAPENTAASLRAGLDAGADRIEVDVGASRDGRIVLLHDATLDRTTSGHGPLRGQSWSEIASLDAGSWFASRFAGEPPIDLDDALAIVRARVPLIVEVKGTGAERERGTDPADREIVDGVLAAFSRTGGTRGVTISSSHWTLLAYAAERAAGVDLALTVRSTESRDPLVWATRTGATALHPSRALCDSEFVSRARGLGLVVIPYTVNRAADARTLIAAGVDGVFTDDPAALRRVLGQGVAQPADRGEVFLGIDQGSGGTRAVLADAEGCVVASREVRVASRRGTGGGVVQDAEAIAGSVVRVAGPLLKGSSRKVRAAGLAVQRSSLLVWRRADSRPVTPVLSWRSAPGGSPLDALRSHEDEIGRVTGLTARHPYGAVRLAGLCASSPKIAQGLREGHLIAGPLGAFLAARLTGRRDAPCDPSLAQRTLGYDIGRGSWSDALLERLGLAASFWPQVAPSIFPRGDLSIGSVRVPLAALLGDVGAAARAVLGPLEDASDGCLCLGTGGFAVAPTGRIARWAPGLLTSLLYEDAGGPVFGIEGAVHGLAAGLLEAGRRAGLDGLPPERIAARAGAAAGLPRVVAAIEGTGTPDWDPTPRFEVEPGRFTPEEIVRGTIEDLASRFATIARLLRDAKACPARFVATGGIAAPHFVARLAARMEADVEIDRALYRTAAGAALLARDAG